MEFPENIPNSVRSRILIDALPHIQRYNGKIVVVKYGGNAMTNDALKQAVMSDIVLLSLVGVNLPWSGTVSYYLFFVLYLAVQFAVYYFLRNPAEVSYAIAYDSIRPKEPKTEGVALGNIFQM